MQRPEAVVLYKFMCVVHRYMAGQVEFEIELQFNPEMLRNPDKIKQIVNSDTKTPKAYTKLSEADLQEAPDEQDGTKRYDLDLSNNSPA